MKHHKPHKYGSFVTEIKAFLSVCDIISAGEPEVACSLLANGEIVEEAFSRGNLFMRKLIHEETSS